MILSILQVQQRGEQQRILKQFIYFIKRVMESVLITCHVIETLISITILEVTLVIVKKTVMTIDEIIAIKP